MQPVIVTRQLFALKWIGIVVAIALLVGIACSGRRSGSSGESDAASSGASSSSPEDEGPCPSVEESDRNKVVAQVGEVEITVCDVSAALNKMSPYLRKAYESPQKRQQFLDNMIRFELIAQEAQRRGYATDAEVQRVRKQMMIQRLNKNLQESVRLSDISEEEMRAYYEEHASDYHKAEMVRIAQIVLESQADAKRVLDLAQSKASDSRYFRQLAREHSVDTKTREHGGDLPYFPRVADRQEEDEEIPEAIVEAAFSLDMREPLYTKVIQADSKFHVIRLRGRRKARDLSFDDVKRQIRHRLHRDKLREARDDLVAKLRKNSSIVVDEEQLAKVKIDLPAETPDREGPPIPGKRPMPPGAGGKAPRAGAAPAKAGG